MDSSDRGSEARDRADAATERVRQISDRLAHLASGEATEPAARQDATADEAE